MVLAMIGAATTAVSQEARAPRALLEAVAALEPSAGRPVLEFWMRSGDRAVGVLVDLRFGALQALPDDAVAAIVLLDADARGLSETVLHLPVSEVVGVAVRQGARLDAVLAGRAASLDPADEPPASRLALAAAVAAEGAAVAARLGAAFETVLARDSLAEGQADLDAAKAAARMALRALEAVAGDDLGLEAVRSLRRVEIAVASTLRATLEDGQLLIATPAPAPEPAALRDAIAAAL